MAGIPEKFVAQSSSVIVPACASCEHRSKKSPMFCLAFPSGKGIPVAILMGENDHTKPFDGDHGVQYKAKA